MSFTANPISTMFFWKTRIGHIDLDSIVEKCEPASDWRCSVRTSRKIPVDWSGFLLRIESFIKELPINRGLSFEDPWMNVYLKNDYQEIHHHASDGSVLSYCYFYKLPQKSGEFLFFNEQFKNYSLSQLDYLIDLRSLGIYEWNKPKIEEGDLIVFPSFALHSVSPNKADTPRVTVSGNLRIT